MDRARRLAAPSAARGKKTGRNPTDRGTGGVKRRLQVEGQGIPIGIALEGANRHDLKLTDSTLNSQPPAVAEARRAWEEAQMAQRLGLDAGYDDDQVREVVAAHGYTAHIRPRDEEAQAKKAGQRARRWVVERTHSWLNRYRHLLIRRAKKPKITWPCCPFPLPISPGTVAYWDRLLDNGAHACPNVAQVTFAFG